MFNLRAGPTGRAGQTLLFATGFGMQRKQPANNARNVWG
jgi:hypothetical protein